MGQDRPGSLRTLPLSVGLPIQRAGSEGGFRPRRGCETIPESAGAARHRSRRTFGRSRIRSSRSRWLHGCPSGRALALEKAPVGQVRTLARGALRADTRFGWAAGQTRPGNDRGSAPALFACSLRSLRAGSNSDRASYSNRRCQNPRLSCTRLFRRDRQLRTAESFHFANGFRMTSGSSHQEKPQGRDCEKPGHGSLESGFGAHERVSARVGEP